MVRREFRRVSIANHKSQITILFCFLCFLCVESPALDRNAFTFTAYDLKVQITPAEQALAATGSITLRNDSAAPQRVVTLQISSTLQWQSIQMARRPVQFLAEQYTTDIDHTGGVSEAVVTLAREVPSKATVMLDISYAGTVPDTRVKQGGVPVGVAAHSDWDQISSTFTGVRGIGYACWYPVSADAVSLTDAAQFSHVLGAWKQRQAGATMKLALAVASDHTVVANGRLIGQRAETTASGTVQHREYEFTPMGLNPPAFFVGDYTVLARPAINVFHFAGHQGGAQEYALAAEKLLPFISEWFGAARDKVTVVELPEGAAPWESGAMYFAPLGEPERKSVEVAVAHELVHACFSSPRLWVAEGLAHFAQALVRERQDGRSAALAYMQTFRPALAEAERQPNENDPLTRATDEVLYRAKGMFVWWMLRDMTGDRALQAALHAYRAADDKEPSYVQRLVETQARRSLEWFFDDWVYRDRGLPDFRITAATARSLLEGNVTVTVTVENVGGAGAEVPVLVPVEKGAAEARVLAAAHGQAVARIQAPAVPAEVRVNDGSVPEADVTNNTFKVARSP